MKKLLSLITVFTLVTVISVNAIYIGPEIKSPMWRSPETTAIADWNRISSDYIKAGYYTPTMAEFDAWRRLHGRNLRPTMLDFAWQNLTNEYDQTGQINPEYIKKFKDAIQQGDKFNRFYFLNSQREALLKELGLTRKGFYNLVETFIA